MLKANRHLAFIGINVDQLHDTASLLSHNLKVKATTT